MSTAPHTCDHAPAPAGTHPADTLRQAGLDVRPLPGAIDETPVGLRRAVAQRDVPLLFRGLTDDWPARRAWTPDAVRHAHGGRQVTALMHLPADGVLYPRDQALYEQTLTMVQFIDAMLTASPASPCYLAYQRAADLFDIAECRFAELLGERDELDSDTRVWIGSAGTRSMLHSDLKGNLFCQIWGEKSVTLLSWRESPAAYPFPDNLVNSQIDIARPDLARFPRLSQVTFFSGVVGPGDILYIPRGWWHDIRSRTPSVSVNHWFGPPQSFSEYLALLARLGPAYWRRTASDFVRHGLLGQREETRFFFSPPSTGKRLYQALTTGSFSRDNDPTS